MLRLKIPTAMVVIVAAGLIAGCGPTNPRASSSASLSPASSPSAIPSAAVMTVDAANAQIRSQVTGAHPLLLPTAIPRTWSAVITQVGPAFFNVTYTSADGRQAVQFAIVVPNPPPPGPNGSQSAPGFHGDARPLYQVGDKTQLTSDRWLIWNEPGTWAMANGMPGVPYFLTTKGLSETEFWAVANSVK